MKKIVSLLLTVLMICTMLTIFAVPAFAKENTGDNKQSDSGSVFTAFTDDSLSKNGSVLSEGDLTIICTVAAAVIFGLGGFFLGKSAEKKKKTQ